MKELEYAWWNKYGQWTGPVISPTEISFVMTKRIKQTKHWPLSYLTWYKANSCDIIEDHNEKRSQYFYINRNRTIHSHMYYICSTCRDQEMEI